MKEKNLYIFDSYSLMKLAIIEGNFWLESQKNEFSKADPASDSFAHAFNEYQKTKNLYVQIVVVATINGNNHNYNVMSDGMILNAVS